MENPAKHVIDKCGGHKAVAEMTGTSLTNVYRWTYPKESGGTGGLIPAKYQAPLLTAAKKSGINLLASDFINGEAA